MTSCLFTFILSPCSGFASSPVTLVKENSSPSMTSGIWSSTSCSCEISASVECFSLTSFSVQVFSNKNYKAIEDAAKKIVSGDQKF